MISIIPITIMGNCIRMRTYILEFISKVYAHLYLMGTCIRMRAYIISAPRHPVPKSTSVYNFNEKGSIQLPFCYFTHLTFIHTCIKFGSFSYSI